MRTNLVIYGIREPYRAAIAKAVGDRLDMPFCCLDGLIRYEAERYTLEYAAQDYKNIESRVVRQASSYADVVISLNSVAFEQPHNIDTLANTGVMIWLKCAGPIADAGCHHGFRSCADIIIEIDELSHEETFEAVIEGLRKHEEERVVR